MKIGYVPLKISLAILLCFSTISYGGELKERLDHIRSYSADFEQRVINNKGKVIEISQGTMALSKPGRFRWYTMKPNKQLLIADGKMLWIYDVDLEQVTVNDQNASLAHSPARILSDNVDEMLEQYKISATKSPQSVEKYLLTSQDKEAAFKSIRLDFWQNKLQTMELANNFGQRSVIQFKNVQINSELNKSLFTFKPPRGVDVIDNSK